MTIPKQQGGGLSRPGTRCLRPRRVVVLLAGVVVLSAADLAVTLMHLRSDGLIEANPIAAYLVSSTNSATMLVAYKTLMVGLCVGLLYRARASAGGEIAAWLAIAILAFMANQWFRYTQLIDGQDEVMVAQGLTLAGNRLYLD